MRDLAYRRAQRKRIRDRFRKIVTHCWGASHCDDWREWAVRKFAETRKPCSCSGCGNQRKHYGPPARELRKLQE